MNSLLGVLLWQVLLLGAPGLVSRLAFGLHSDLMYLLTLPGCAVVLVTAFRRSVPRFAFAAAGSLHVLGLVVVYEYNRLSNMDLNAALVFETGTDAIVTVFRSLTLQGMGRASALIALVLLASWAFYLYALDLGVRKLERAPPRQVAPIAILLVIIVALFAHSGWAFYRDLRDLRAAVAQITSRAPPPPPAGARASVIVLHLESVNASAMFEHTRDGFAWRAPFPGLRALWEERGGVLYPFFWSNTFATNRGVESLLCGVTGNLGRDLGSGKRSGAPCLPAILRERGYRTPYYYSFFDTDFYDFKHFLPDLGFSSVVYGSQIMREGDRRFNWGYDDCAFYDRLGEKFANDDGSPFFAYVEVSMHHAPFDNVERRYPESWPYPNANTYAQRYANSLSEQDHCLPRFAAALGKLRQPVHVFVVGDHSVPIRTNFDLEDRFMTTLLYLPPKARASRSIPTFGPPSQADLYATIVDLLYDRRAPNSFADALRGGDTPPTCATLANQYGVLAFARPKERARYTLDERVATVETPNADSGWTVRFEDVSFPKFLELYSCQR